MWWGVLPPARKAWLPDFSGSHAESISEGDTDAVMAVTESWKTLAGENLPQLVSEARVRRPALQPVGKPAVHHGIKALQRSKFRRRVGRDDSRRSAEAVRLR